MKDYIVKIEIALQAENELEAKKKFWEIVDDSCASIEAKVELEN